VAWIDRTTYQIIRMRMDLLAPRPEAGLDEETTDITYREVRFPEMPGTALWLPQEVTVTIDWEGKIKVVSKVVSPDLPGRDNIISRQAASVPPDVHNTALWEHRVFLNTHRYSDYKLFSSKSRLVF
jgi:hypothetical protein